jgi:Tol biopolymer transport system component
LFVRDRATNTTERVGLEFDGSQIPAADVWAQNVVFSGATISANGRYVAYSTWAPLDPRDAAIPPTPSWPDKPDVYLYDRVAHTTELVSVDTAGNPIHGWYPTLSADGRYVGFEHISQGSDGSDTYPIFVRDRQAATTTMVFANAAGSSPIMSRNGRYIVTDATGLTCLERELTAIDLSDGSTERIDVTDDGVGAEADNHLPPMASISDDGRYVAFLSASWNLAGLDGPTTHGGAFDQALLHAYVRDRQELSTTQAPDFHAPYVDWTEGTALTGDGRHIVFQGEGSGAGEVVDLDTGTTMPVGPGPAPNNLNTIIGSYGSGGVSGDGRYIAFTSQRYTSDGQRVRGEAFVQRVS